MTRIIVFSGGSRGGRRGRSPPPPPPHTPRKKRERERATEREGEGAVFRPSIKHISAFIHSPVKCNKSLCIFTRCIALLVYLITFELLKQSTINQKSDINFIKIHPSIHPFRNSVQASYFERFHWSILACCCSVFRCRYAPRSVVSKNSKLANENVQNN